MSYQLKVKAKSLAAEAKIIRLEETKTLLRATISEALQTHYGADEDETPERLKAKARHAERARRARAAFEDLRSHRKVNVRRAARATHLARAYLKGRRYREIEPFAYTKPEKSAIQALIQRYGALDAGRQPVTVAEWLDEPAPPRALIGEWTIQYADETEGHNGLSVPPDEGFVSPAAA